MEQNPLFHEDLSAALGYLVSALGGNKKVGCAMWPTLAKDPEKARRKVSDCLNENHQQRFSFDDLQWLLRAGREAGIHSVMAYLNQDAGYAEPSPIEPEDERAKLQRQYIEATKMMSKLALQMERFSEAPVKAVS